MKLLILIVMIIYSHGYFTGCPMDGCESTLSHFVDIAVDGFDKNTKWQRSDLLTNSSRGCVSNGLSSLICSVDVGYVSINITNGELLWSITLEIKERTETASLPVVNYEGFMIIANNTRCTLVDPQGVIRGVFDYTPMLIPPLAGPFVTDDGQIVVADLISFVGIEDSGIPLGVQSLPQDFVRLSRSMSLNRNDARWYLIAQHNTTASLAIIAAETSGSIVGRLRIVWVYEYGVLPNLCNGMEGPLLSMDRKWLFVVNTTGILIINDNEDSATVEYLVSFSDLCPNDMAYCETDSTLLVVDKNTYNIIALNVSTKNVSYTSLTHICQEEIIGQLTHMTIIKNNRLIIVVITGTRQALLLLIDYNNQKLLARFNLGYIIDISKLEPLTQLAYTETDDQQLFVTIAHKTIGLATVRLVTLNK
ncbi:unnamed protein product [Rotaria socialis]|uniref:Uncharacterized protein n=2 Tax=Rotaria socialis TaxID=392032 RepID=A0A819AHS6_9BILA|nr:unnamed protein product [Rotaria socialis]CAF3777762.1 unnamed protein product [Rotaria socialis]